MKHCNRDCPDSDLGNCDHPSNCAKLELGIEDFWMSNGEREVTIPAVTDTLDKQVWIGQVMMQTDPHVPVVLPSLKWQFPRITEDMFKDFLLLQPTTPEYPVPKVRLKSHCLSKDHFYGRYRTPDNKYLALEIMTPLYPPYTEPKLGEPMTRGGGTMITMKVVVLDEADLPYYKVVRIQESDQPPHIWKSATPIMYMEPVYGKKD